MKTIKQFLENKFLVKKNIREISNSENNKQVVENNLIVYENPYTGSTFALIKTSKQLDKVLKTINYKVSNMDEWFKENLQNGYWMGIRPAKCKEIVVIRVVQKLVKEKQFKQLALIDIKNFNYKYWKNKQWL